LPIHTKWQIRSKGNSKVILTEDLEIHIIELPKITEKIEEGSLKKWILFLENPEGEETKKMAEKEKEIKEAIETLENISSDEVKERIAELRQKYIMDKKSELRTAEEIGMKKGLLEVARKLKEENIPYEIIEKTTGISENEIEKL